MSNKPIIIHIPEPCSQQWDEMTTVQGGRHCDSCSETVIDFTTWSDAALYNFFSKNTGHVCGMYLTSQVGRSIGIPYQPHSKLYRLAITMGLTLMFTHAPSIYAQSKPSKTVSSTSRLAGDSVQPTSTGFGEIKGVVLDNRNEPVINTSVRVTQNGIVKGGCVTDFDGKYSVRLPEGGIYKVEVNYLGYIGQESVGIIAVDSVRVIDFKLNKNPNIHLKDVRVITMGKSVIKNHK